MESQRDIRIDIIKGIGIIFVVFGHAYSNGSFVDLFHMPLFFMVAGYCYKETYSDNIEGLFLLFKKRLFSLYVPYIGYNLFYLFIHNLLCELQIYSTDSNLTTSFELVGTYDFPAFIRQLILILGFIGGEQLDGACWFLRVLFIVTMLVAITEFIIKKIVKREKTREISKCIMAVIYLIVGYIFCQMHNLLIMQIPVALSMYIFFYLGQKFNKIRNNIKDISNVISIFSVIICGGIIYFFKDKVYISHATNQYDNPIILVVLGVVGWIFVWCIADILIHFKIKSLIQYIGKHTIQILSLHFLFFKIITFILIILRDEPRYMLASFPTHPDAGWWWISYMVVGIVLPLLCYSCGELCKKLAENILYIAPKT